MTCYVAERVHLYNEKPSDGLLYTIGIYVGVLGKEDQDLYHNYQQGDLNPTQRFNVLNWLRCEGFEIKESPEP